MKVGQILGLSKNGSWALVDARPFLGGLSLHLNHLIAWHTRISFGNLGHFPLEFFCQIWAQDTL